MSIITVSNLTFSYPGSYENIFENINFQIDTDWKLGFIGRNGRGKTTFLNLLLGQYMYSGKISHSVKFEYFPYIVNDETLNTLDVMKSICQDCMDWEILREISWLDVHEDVLSRPFYTLSKGEQTKVLLAALFLTSSRFLLIDEPTSHLDLDARETVRNYLKKKNGFILVSHDRSLLDECIDHVLSINKANIEIQKGNFTSWWENKSMQDNYELAEDQKLRKEISRLAHSSARVANWSALTEKSKYGKSSSGSKVDKGYVGHKSAKVMKRAKHIEARQQEAISEKSKLLHNIEQNDTLKIWPLDFHKHRLIEVNNLSISYGEREVFSHLSFNVNKGDRIALMGKNGGGKSSLLKLIHGESISFTGELKIGSGLIISYISQDTSFLQGNLHDFIHDHQIDETLFKTILRKLDVGQEQFDKTLSDFSSGQKKKVLIAKSLCQKAHLYVWDEPINYIDILSRMQIEQVLQEYQPTLLFVEHDRLFCLNIATKFVKV